MTDGAGIAAAQDVVFAGFWRRFGAYVIDTLVLSVGYFAFSFAVIFLAALAGHPIDPEDEVGATGVLTLGLFLGYYVVAALYYALQECSARQATLGKRAVGIKVCDEAGRRLRFGQAFGRWFAALLSYVTFLVGFVLAAFTRRKQALHDMVAETLVVDRWAFTESPERQQRHIGFLPFLMVFVFALVPVLGILAAIAVPAYQDYVRRAEVATAIQAADPLKALVLAGRTDDGGCAVNGEGGIGEPADYAGPGLASIDVGTITDTGNCGMQLNLAGEDPDATGDGAAGRVWIEYDADAEAWLCTSDLQDRVLPTSCRG